MTIRVDNKTKQRLEKLAEATARTKSFLVAEAIRSYLDLNEWQIKEIRHCGAVSPMSSLPSPRRGDRV
ncbi:MAG: ribbon-helix-helix protein, CopG family [Deltaproteobacteria bacterium]|nr:ribbon-helix-helix protein, CopG family [Deltaproteobacteria bacterium]